MLYVTTVLWDANERSQPFSRCYDETWVEKLHRAFQRNLTRPYQFVVFTDRPRKFSEPLIEQLPLSTKRPDYGCCIEPFRLDAPMIFVGLDTVIVRNIDHFADYCLTADRIALPRDPYQPERSINGVVLAPAGYRRIFSEWRGENDMEWLRREPCAFIDDLWPGEVISLKFHKVRDLGVQDARIVYFHGKPKPHELMHHELVREHWR